MDFHENILRFYGITTVGKTIINEYALVLEYADSGTLKNYLQHNFDKLKWDDKYQFTLQLASTVACIHECDIIHRDLHAGNVFVHQKKLKLADFGLSRKIAESSNNPNLFGLLPYVDSKKLKDKKHYNLIDIYSIGVLMWQISSGYQLYGSDNYVIGLAISIAMEEKREEIIEGTPVKYSKLYAECWKYEPDERPNIQVVVSILKALVSPEQNNTKFDDVYKENISSEKYKSSSKSSDINKSLLIDSAFDNIETKSNLSLQNQVFVARPEEEPKSKTVNILSEKYESSLKSSDLNENLSPGSALNDTEHKSNLSLQNQVFVARSEEQKSKTVIEVPQSQKPIIKKNNLKDGKPKINIPPNNTHNKNEKAQQTMKQKDQIKGQKDQQWFDVKFSEMKDIAITGSKRLNLTSSLKVESFYNLESISLKKLKIANLEINRCSRLNITNLSELTKLTSLSVTYCPKLITLNCLSNGLTNLELSGCYRLNNTDLSKFTKLKSLYLRGYRNLTMLDCSSMEKLINLRISDCLQLKNIINLSKSSKLEN
ncbi:kinase-like domain-containing protein [Rhizophagus diaphanus]|nr:kinase-like domain-containing protein [Rhizophagus diaphanus] [Rhizophagus sp. MUCL 43196]